MKAFLTRHMVVVTLLGALIVEAVLLPESWRVWTPLWLYLTLTFWSIALPNAVRFRTAWIFGVLQDLLIGVWTGVHVLSFSITLYVFCRLHTQTMNTPLPYRLVITLLLLAVHLMYLQWILHLMTGAPWWPLPWQSWLGSALIAVPLFYALDAGRERFLAA